MIISLTLERIYIATNPTKTAYKAGEVFDPAGMVVKADYALDGIVIVEGKEVTGYTYPATGLAAGTTKVTISLTEGGVTSGLNAGNYTCRFTLVDTDLYVWSNGSTAAYVDVGWSIGQATPTFSVSPSSVTLNTSNLTKQCTITTNSTGGVTANSSASGVATCSVSGSIATVSHVNKTSGSATITLSLAATTNYKAATCTIAVTASFVSTTLSENSLDTISEVSQAGTGDTYWDVGDAYPMMLNGTVGTKSFSNLTLYVYIVHFNMPMNKTTSENNIIWQGFKSAATNGKDVALRDWTAAQAYGDYKTDGTKLFNMNHWGNYNYGGSVMSTTTATRTITTLTILMRSPRIS